MTRIEWSYEDNCAAQSQGWIVTYAYMQFYEGYQIERFDENNTFNSDQAAINYVTHNAEAGCRLAQKAIAYIRQEGGRIYH